MEFGKHIVKGVWAFADKLLAVIYGLGFVFFVIRVLPQGEYGLFVLIQSLFALIMGLGTSLALQPLVKYAAETDRYGAILSACAILYTAFATFISLVLILFRYPLAALLDQPHAEKLVSLIAYVPLILFASLVKAIAVSLLQTRYRIKEIFWIDLVFFGGSILLFYAAGLFSMLNTAEDLLHITIAAHGCSSFLSLVLSWKLFRVASRPSRIEFSNVWNFGKILLASSVSYSFYAQLDVFFLSSLGGVVQVAIYSAAKIFTRIFDVVTQVIQMFIVPASSRLHAAENRNSLQALVEKGIWFSTIALVPFLALFITGSDLLVRFFYKDRYAEAAIPLRIFGLMALTTPWHSVLSSVLVGIGRVKEGLYVGWLFIGTSVVSYLLLIPPFGGSGAAAAGVLASFVLSFCLAFVTNKYLPVRLRNIVARNRDLTNYLKEKAFVTRWKR